MHRYVPQWSLDLVGIGGGRGVSGKGTAVLFTFTCEVAGMLSVGLTEVDKLQPRLRKITQKKAIQYFLSGSFIGNPFSVMVRYCG